MFLILSTHVIGSQVIKISWQYFVVKCRTSKRRRRQTCHGGEPTQLRASASSLPSPHGWPAAFHEVSTWNNRVFLETQHFAHLEPLLDRLEPRKYGRSLAPSCAVKEILKEEVIPAIRMRRRDYYAESAGVHSM